MNNKNDERKRIRDDKVYEECIWRGRWKPKTTRKDN